MSSGDLEVTLESAGAKFSAQSGGVEFIRDLVASGLSFTANLSEVGDRVDFNLTDGADKSQKITASFIAEKSGYISAWVCGELISAKLAKLNEAKALAISYDQEGGYLYLTSSIRAKLKNTAYGEAFNGFTSGKVYASLDLSNSTVYISQINSQRINSSIERDSVAPAIVMAGDYGELYRAKGEVLTIMDAFAADVLSPYTSMTLRVTDPNGNFVTAIDGTVLSGTTIAGGENFGVTLSEFGAYTVFYFAKDWANKSKTVSYTITVGDTKAPSVTLNGEIASTQKIGWIKLPSATVTDDVTTLPNLTTTVISPSFRLTILGDDLEYYVSEKGNYSVIYTAMDVAGNTTVIKRSFEVR